MDQGGNKRPGAFAIYIEPWHADILSFLNLRKNTGVVSRGEREFVFIRVDEPEEEHRRG